VVFLVKTKAALDLDFDALEVKADFLDVVERDRFPDDILLGLFR